MLVENYLSNIIIKEAIRVHRILGSWLLDSTYKDCLYHRILAIDLLVRIEVPVPWVLETVKLECGYYADLIAGIKLIMEVRSKAAWADIHKARILTYLRLTNINPCIRLNFNPEIFKEV